MKILVDTSVWSLALRRQGGTLDAKVTQLHDLIAGGQTIYLLGVILQEILQGIGNREQFHKLRQYLEPFPMIELLRNDYVFAAQLGSDCRHKGIQASTVDYLIAAAAIQHDCYLLTADKDFIFVASVSALKLL